MLMDRYCIVLELFEPPVIPGGVGINVWAFLSILECYLSLS